MSIEIVSKANACFKNRQYNEALPLYEKAAMLMGTKSFAYNIDACKRAIKSDDNRDTNLNESHAQYVNEVFDQVFLVNLKKDKIKKFKSITQLKINKIEFEIIEATDGFAEPTISEYKLYAERQTGDLTRYAAHADLEKYRKSKFIESAGAYGYIKTYIRILQLAASKGLNRILILEDDVIFSNDFGNLLKKFLNNIPVDWKLIQLGASQYEWKSVNIEFANSAGFYQPRSLHTCGSFAIGIDSSIFQSLIEAQSAFEAPFDHLPMGEIYEKHIGKCFVAFPNMVMPDVSSSNIRGGRNQFTHGQKMKWQVEKFDYPQKTPHISVIISNASNLKYYTNLNNARNRPYVANFYIPSEDGLRPVHSITSEVIKSLEHKTHSLNRSEIELLSSEYIYIPHAEECITEERLEEVIEQYPAQKIKHSSNTKKYTAGLVSVIIPTYKRPTNLLNSLQSVATQDYENIEIIVVSDNGIESKFNIETKSVILDIKQRFPKLQINYIEHTKNRNGSAARNTGILASRGEYICFLDDDDIYLPGRISKTIQAIQDTDQAIGAIYCGFLGWNSPVNDLKRYPEGDLTKEILLLNYKAHYLQTNTATYKREAVLAINGFDETYKRHQDLEFNLRFFERYKIGAVKECLVQLNPAPSSINNKVYNLDKLQVKQKFLSQFRNTIHRNGEDFAERVYQAHLNETYNFIKEFKIEAIEKSELTHNFDNYLLSNLTAHADIKNATSSIRSTIEKSNKTTLEASSDPVKPEDIFVIIPCCEKYQYKLKALRQTWAGQLKNYNIRYLFLLGRPELDHPKINDDILYVPAPDNYESLLLKLALGYEFIYRNFDFKFIYKIDDDCYLNLEMLSSDIIPQLKGCMYAGGAIHPKNSKMNEKWHFGKCSNPRFDKPFKYNISQFDYAKGGYGYFLSKSALPKIIDYIALFKLELENFIYSYEDVRVAEILIESEINPFQLEKYTTKLGTNCDSELSLLIFDIREEGLFYTIDKIFHKNQSARHAKTSTLQ